MKKLTKSEQQQNAIEEATQRLIENVNNVIDSLAKSEKFTTLWIMHQEVNSWDGSLDTQIEPIEYINDIMDGLPFLEALEKINTDNFNILDEFIVISYYGIETADRGEALDTLELLQDEIIEGTINNWEHIYHEGVNETAVNLINEFYESLERGEVEKFGN